MFVIALDHFLEWIEPGIPKAVRWHQVRTETRRNIRQHLWDATRQKFIPHIYLEGSPFPEEFDESVIFYHGGTAVAIEAGLLSLDEIRASLAAMRDNVKKAGASSIALIVYPPYPDGFFPNRSMAPWSYQNGGDWCWFGGRMIQQLIHHGLVAEAYQELNPMVSRVLEQLQRLQGQGMKTRTGRRWTQATLRREIRELESASQGSSSSGHDNPGGR